MFDPTLTLEAIHEEIEHSSEQMEYVFTKEDPYLAAVKVMMANQRVGRESSHEEINRVNSSQKANPIHQALLGHIEPDDEDSVHELLMNAFEHGSSWGQSGAVTVKVINDPKKPSIFILIEQPQSGFNVKNIMSHTRKEIGNTLAGGGLAGVLHDSHRTGFEDISQKDYKFRTILMLNKNKEAE